MTPLDDTLTLGEGIVLAEPMRKLREAALEIAAIFCEGQVDDPPMPWVAHVQDEVLERMVTAAEGTRVSSLAGFARDRGSSAAADRDATRVLP